jgi:hypothetical protein
MDSFVLGLIAVIVTLVFSGLFVLSYICFHDNCIVPILNALIAHKIEVMKAEHEAKIKLIKGLD